MAWCQPSKAGVCLSCLCDCQKPYTLPLNEGEHYNWVQQEVEAAAAQLIELGVPPSALYKFVLTLHYIIIGCSRKLKH